MSNFLKNRIENSLNAYKCEFSISKYLETAEKLEINITALGFGAYELTKGKITRRFMTNGLRIDKENVFTYKLCGNKYLTYKIMLNKGIRYFPKHRLYTFRDVRNTYRDFKEWNCPVVIKPCSGTSGGKGVTVSIRSIKELKKAICESFVFDRRAYLMEQYIEGSHFRVLTLKGNFLACSQRIPARIVGNGKDSVKKLIEEENRKRREDKSEKALYEILIDNEVKRKLKSINKTMDSILEKDEQVYVKDVVNLHSGGEVRNIENVSENIKDTCKKIGNVLDVYLAGFDIVTDDITKPLNRTNRVIYEVNTSPGLEAMYKVTNYDTHVDVAEIILRDMFNL
jgi:cyanophycin synthetase